MNEKPWLLIDYDGTLGGIEIAGEYAIFRAAYTDVLNKFTALVTDRLGYTPELVRAFQAEVDLKACDRYGFSDKKRFANSLVRTYRALALGDESEVHAKKPEVILEIFQLGMSVFEYPYVAVPGALSLLEVMSKHFHIAVCTKGEQETQMTKIVQSGVLPFADEIFVLGKKDEAEWVEVFRRLRISDEQRKYCWAIGDSIKADVNIPVTMGCNGIHIYDAEQWQYEVEEPVAPVPPAQLHVVTDIRDILKLNLIPTVRGF